MRDGTRNIRIIRLVSDGRVGSQRWIYKLKVEGLDDELEKAYEEWGCFTMATHGVPVELLEMR